MKEYSYKDYVKKGKWTKFKELCELNCLDFYSCGCILTAHLVMEDLMQHEKNEWGDLKQKKVTPKDAWDGAMEQTDYHSGASAGMTCSIVRNFSPRGQEFWEWWKEENNI